MPIKKDNTRSPARLPLQGPFWKVTFCVAVIGWGFEKASRERSRSYREPITLMS